MMLMKRKMSQLLIVDVQDKVLGPIPNGDDILKNIVRLIHAAKKLGVPITVSEHYPKGLGSTHESLRHPLGDEAACFDKIHFSCLKNDAIRHHLEDHRDHGRGQIVVAGVETHVCVGQTTLDLIGDGYEVFVAADAVGSRAERSRDLALRRFERAGAFVVDSEMVMFEWLEKADTDEFRALLPLIK
ncbi:MAG: hydrolase [Rhodomicrobiaceae bacterium]